MSDIEKITERLVAIVNEMRENAEDMREWRNLPLADEFMQLLRGIDDAEEQGIGQVRAIEAMVDYLPEYEQDVITVDVENDFQKNQLEMSKRAMLEYWRNHFQLNVDEIEFVIHEHERKKVIYTSEDKVQNMLEQNPALKDFLQVLNFRIKD